MNSSTLNRILHRIDAKGQLAPDKRRVNVQPTGEAQGLSEVEASEWYIPPTYLNRYHKLLETNPGQAQAFWDKWKIRREPKRSVAVIEHERRLRQASEALSRVVNGNELKRRV